MIQIKIDISFVLGHMGLMIGFQTIWNHLSTIKTISTGTWLTVWDSFSYSCTVWTVLKLEILPNKLAQVLPGGVTLRNPVQHQIESTLGFNSCLLRLDLILKSSFKSD